MTLKEEIITILNNFTTPKWNEEMKKALADQILLAIQARLLKDAFIDYPDTEDGRKARYENSLYNSAIQKMRDSLK